MRRHEPPERRNDDAVVPEREAEPPPAATVLGLQRSAGNRAVSALLARQPAPANTAAPEPASEERGATMTLGLGDDIVIPLESMTWGTARGGEIREVIVTFVSNPAAPKLQQAAVQGKRFPTGFLSSTALMSTMTDIMLSGYQFSTSSEGEEPVISVTLDFASIEHKPVR